MYAGRSAIMCDNWPTLFVFSRSVPVARFTRFVVTALPRDKFMSMKSDTYRTKAEQAEASAKSTRDLSAQHMYEEVARHYRYLEEQQNIMDRRAGHAT